MGCVGRLCASKEIYHMMCRRDSGYRLPPAVIAAAVFLTLGLASQAPAQDEEYRIGPGDVLSVTFWQDPDLNTEVQVGQDGRITLDIIGQIQAAGKTTEQLQTDIVRNISRLNKNISQATVRVLAFNYNHVYVIGQVNSPGKQSFEVIPDLWTLINEAGGVAEAGDLTRVTIIRGGDEAGKVEVVNVSQALAEGKLSELPKVGREDTIEIPRTPGSIPGGELARTEQKKNLIYVIGAVNSPGPISYESDIDVAEAIAYAGGPSDAADVTKTQLVIKDGYYSQTVTFDLREYATKGKPARYIMQKEDMIVIPADRPNFFEANLGLIATALGTVTTTILIIDQLNSGETTTR
ncbi:hypothetical protein GF377_03155 [candidate division GN15 bacterium]|nr:hypothetical protein [candidate division GN15 bacterium]